MDLKLERNANTVSESPIRTPSGGTIAITPPLDGETYWTFRVRVGDPDSDQALIAFPKFFTLGIGFAKEKDWNTNLPYSCEAQEIWDHIKHNRGDCGATDEECLKAIELLQEACESETTTATD